MRALGRCLRAELGSALFSTEYQINFVVGLEHIVPQTGAYMYGSERLKWSYNNAREVLILWLKMRLDGTNELRCNDLDISMAIDHGKAHSRITVTFVAH